MKQAKPICVIYYSPDIANGASMARVNEGMQTKMPDYHVLTIPSNQSYDGSCEDVRLQVFHPKDFTPIQYQELKDLIMAEIEKITQKD